MDVKVERMHKNNHDSKLKAYVDLIFDDELIVKGFKIIEGEKGLFLANPSEKGKNDKFYNTVLFKEMEQKEVVQKVVLEEYNK